MKNYFFILVLALMFEACRHSPDKSQEKYFETEINDRITVLNKIDTESDSLKIKADEIHAEVNKILLLSKDVENLGASVRRANEFFKNSATRYEIEGSEFAMINITMHVDAIAYILK